MDLLGIFCNHYFNMVYANLKLYPHKAASNENFPVGSWFLPRELRPHIITFYNFARSADNIADSVNMDPHKKFANLHEFEQIIRGQGLIEEAPVEAVQMYKSLKETNISQQHCIDLITAFKQDTNKNRYRTWNDLLQYCQLSAAPVGRYMIDLHGGFITNKMTWYESSDSLCIALQVLNHIQDCSDDFQSLNRVYLPSDTMNKYCADENDLSNETLTPNLRDCLDNILDVVDQLVLKATKLPPLLNSSRLGIESQIIINIAQQLSKKLRKLDPVESRIELSGSSYAKCCITGIIGYFITTKRN